MTVTGLGASLPHWLERAWMQRYLDGELTPDELAAFEAYLLDRPHLVAELEADNLLRDAIAANPAFLLEARGTDVLPGAKGPGENEPRNSYRLPVAWLSMAAGLVLGVGLAWLGSSNPGPVVPPRIIYDTLRGELAAPREEPGDSHSPIRLYELPVPPGATIVAAGAVREGNHVRLPQASPSADGYVTYALPSTWRGQGELHLDIAFADGRGSGSRLVFPL